MTFGGSDQIFDSLHIVRKREDKFKHNKEVNSTDLAAWMKEFAKIVNSIVQTCTKECIRSYTN